MSASCPHILQPVASLNPRTFYKNTILEYISNTRNNLCAVNCRKVCAEVIVIAGFGVCLPSGIQNSEFCIIILTCSLIRENSGILAFFYAVNISVVETIVFKTGAVVKNTIIIKFAVNNAACKNAVNVKFAVYNAVCLFVAEQAFAVNKVVSRCGNGRAPVNNGVADFAERSARVARFRAGRGLVRKSNGCMLMPRSNIESSALVALVNTDIAVSAHRFAVYLNLCGRECSERTVFKYDTSCFCQKLNIHRIYAFFLRYNPVGIFAESVMRIPYANGNRSNNSFSSIGNGRCFS